MKNRLLLVLSALTLTACAGSSAKVVKTYELGKPAGAPYSRILVVGAHPDRAVRRAFEEALVGSLRSEQVDAVASISIAGMEAELTRETVGAAAGTARADAVLVSRPEDVRWSATEAESRSTMEVQRKDADNMIDFFRYDYIEYEDPMPLSTVRTVVISTDLYRVSDQAKVWSVESTGVGKDTAMDVIDAIAAATTRQLRRDELVD
jgi:hypothetical protein